MNKKYLAEFIGTFFLVFTFGTAGVLGLADKLAPLAIGSIYMAMIFATGHISGGHLNPAVSLAVLLRGKLPGKELLGYLLAQIGGGVVAALMVGRVINGGAGVVSDGEINLVPALVCEFLFTFALCLVVLNTATAKGTEGNSYYGLAIGFTVLAGAFAVDRISGAVFNPAIGVGLIILGSVPAKTILFYFVAQFAGAFVASVAFQQTNGKA